MANSHTKLLILDIDETLVFANAKPINGIQPDFEVGPYVVHKRPGVDNFLLACAHIFDELALWTTGSNSYAHAIARHLFLSLDLEPSFVWCSDRCTAVRQSPDRPARWIKDLKKVARRGYNLRRVLMVDNSPEKLRRHRNNLLHVQDFKGNPDDRELPLLNLYLPMIVNQNDLRILDKRTWRSQATAQDFTTPLPLMPRPTQPTRPAPPLGATNLDAF